MKVLKYRNDALFQPVNLQLTSIMKVEKEENQLIQVTPTKEVKKEKEFYEYESNWPKNKNNKFIGLQNLGNTCYLNSFFQSILNIPHIYNLIFKMKETDELHFESTFGKTNNSSFAVKGIYLYIVFLIK